MVFGQDKYLKLQTLHKEFTHLAILIKESRDRLSRFKLTDRIYSVEQYHLDSLILMLKEIEQETEVELYRLGFGSEEIKTGINLLKKDFLSFANHTLKILLTNDRGALSVK